MGSGLILLVIVGAWLAVLVPMALRSNDVSSMGTVDKFHDAMRVLSRRDGVARARDSDGVARARDSDGVARARDSDGVARARDSGGRQDDEVDGPSTPEAMPSRDVVLRRSGREAEPVEARELPRRSDTEARQARATGLRGVARRDVRADLPDVDLRDARRSTELPADEGRTARTAGDLRARRTSGRVPADRTADRTSGRAGPSAATRRRRALVLLLLVSVATLAGGLLGPLWLLVPHVLTDVALVGLVLWLRKQAVLKEEREWREAMSRRQAPRRRPVAAPRPLVPPTHVAGIPDRMPSRAVLDGRWAPPLVRVEEAPAVPARGAQGAPWQPVPVPVPTYVTAPTAPRRPVSMSRTGDPAEGLAAAERSLGIDDQGPDLEQILDRRRAVGD